MIFFYLWQQLVSGQVLTEWVIVVLFKTYMVLGHVVWGRRGYLVRVSTNVSKGSNPKESFRKFVRHVIAGLSSWLDPLGNHYEQIGLWNDKFGCNTEESLNRKICFYVGQVLILYGASIFVSHRNRFYCSNFFQCLVPLETSTKRPPLVNDHELFFLSF